MPISSGDSILFLGDSVTDCGRSYENDSLLGDGYVHMIAAQWTACFPESNARFLNRGISGNRVRDVRARLERDCLALKPDIVSILIGINDTWRRFDSNDPTSTADYLKDYRTILLEIRSKLKARLILMDPFYLPLQPDQKAWSEDLGPRIDGIRELAREFSATYIPLDGIFAKASTKAACSVWCADGVHPTPAGHALIARSWLEAV
jgi:acyl-CoA thioesterase I